MPEQVSCPHCDKKLRVPDNLLGKTVKCPGCGNQFITSSGEPPPAPEPEAPPSRRAPRGDEYSEAPQRRRPTNDEDEGDDRPGRRPRDDDEEADDRPRRRRRDEGEDDFDEDRRRRKGGRKRRAREQVNVPSILLIVVGILGLLMGLLNVVLLLTGFGVDPKAAGPDMAYQGVGSLLNFVWGGIVTMGGFQMRALRARGSVMTACIFAMLPCNPCCLLGIPFGIWGLVVINSPDVRDAFE